MYRFTNNCSDVFSIGTLLDLYMGTFYLVSKYTKAL